MSKFYIETEGSNYVFNAEIDIGSLTKSMINNDVDSFCREQLNVLGGGAGEKEVSKNSLEKDDKLVFKEGNDWFILENKKTQKFINNFIDNGKLDPNVLGDKYYQKTKEVYAKDKGESYTEEDFNKEILIGQNNLQLVENMELTQELNELHASEDVQSEQNINFADNTSNLEPVSLESSAINVSPEQLINYIKDNSQYEFPYDSNVLRDHTLMNAFRIRLNNEKIESLKDMLERLKAKNDRLRAEINAYKQDDVQKIAQSLRENAELTKELKSINEQEQAMNNIRAKYDPNDSSDMEQLRKEHFEKEQKAQEQKVKHTMRQQR